MEECKEIINGLRHDIINRLMILRTIALGFERCLNGITETINEYEQRIKGLEAMRPTHIIIHHSLTKDGNVVDWDAIRRYHKSWAYNGEIITEDKAKELISLGKIVKEPWKDIGYHFGIERVHDRYETFVGRIVGVIGAHCKEKNMNSVSIGICCVGNFDLVEPPKEQLEMCINLVKSLMSMYLIPIENIFGHRDFAKYKSCPGLKWDMEEFRTKLLSEDK